MKYDLNSSGQFPIIESRGQRQTFRVLYRNFSKDCKADIFRMTISKRKKTYAVEVGHVRVGGGNPIVIQSMTNTPTADITATARQIRQLAHAGAELVRLTINHDAAAKAVPEIKQRLRDQGCHVPLIGDFHFNGHTLLKQYPACAAVLDKYRINPGNVGRGKHKDTRFADIIKVARDHDKPVRIGVNAGSLDPDLLQTLRRHNKRAKQPLTPQQLIHQAMVQSALLSSEAALKAGLKKNKLILSAKMSRLNDMIAVYRSLSRQCKFPLHLGLTEAGGQLQGIVASAAALGILLHQGIGDTIRISLTPDTKTPRTREVEVCQHLLQALGLGYYTPNITSCPGCGRTDVPFFNRLAKDIKKHIARKMPHWRKTYPGVETLTIAIMGCVVNGPGESKHADIGISLPGAKERSLAPVYADGKKIAVLQGPDLTAEFINILTTYLEKRFKARA